MLTEPTAALIPPDVLQNIEKLNGDVQKLEQELSQALAVWQSTLTEEKQKFDDLLEHKNLAWQEQDAQWNRQSQAYEERLAEMKSEFEARLKQTEQNASRALAELDDAWQRDKLEWGPAAQLTQQGEKRQLEAKAQALELQLAQQESAKAAELAMLRLRLEEFEKNAPAEVTPTSETVKTLQAQLLEFQQTVGSLQARAVQSDDLLNACLQALDYQIAVLYDLVYHHATPAVPVPVPVPPSETPPYGSEQS